MTTLRVAEKFEKSHLASPEVAPLIEAAKVFYVEGYFLTHGTDSVLELSKKASEASKVPSRQLLARGENLTTQPGLRPEPLSALHPTVLRCPVAAGHALH